MGQPTVANHGFLDHLPCHGGSRWLGWIVYVIKRSVLEALTIIRAESLPGGAQEGE